MRRPACRLPFTPLPRTVSSGALCLANALVNALATALVIALAQPAPAQPQASLPAPEPIPGRSITQIVITQRLSPTFEGVSFGETGAYEHLYGEVRGELDPDHPRNARIANLDLAPRNARGLVEYRSDIQILQPLDPTRSNGALLLDLPNRGNKRLTGPWVNGGPSLNDPVRAEHAGTGWLMRQGYTLVWVAWEALVAPGGGRLTADFPVAIRPDGSPVVGRTRQEFLFGNRAESAMATLSYPAASLDRSQATLTVRQYAGDPPRLVEDWEFLDEQRIQISRPAGYDADALYELAYEARDPIVLGMGLAALSNTISTLRHDPDPSNPLSGRIDRAFAIGFSQPGRVLRDLLYEGFNADEDGRVVFEGAMPVIAGSRRSNVNLPFGVTGDYSRQHETHRIAGDQFPFTYPVLPDPISGRTDGIFARCRRDATCPKTFHVDSDTEIWQGRASLVVTTPEGGALTLPEDVRAYFIGGSQHGPAATPTRNDRVVHPENPLPFDPYFRALISALDAWVSEGTPPPDSRFPALQNGTLVYAEAEDAQFPTIPGFHYRGLLNELRLRDHGSDPPVEGAAYPVFVGAKDADGNNVAGLRHPFVVAPRATYTGWNVRAEGFAAGALGGLSGSYLPFASSRAERLATGDFRLSLEERWATREAWIAAVERAVAAQVADRVLLQEDAERIVETARRAAWPE